VIFAFIGHSLMLPRKRHDRFASAARTALFSGHRFLMPFQLRLAFSQMIRRFKNRSVRGCRELPDAKVHTRLTVGLRKRLCLDFARKTSVISTVFCRNRAGFDRPSRLPMQFDSHMADLGQCEPRSFQNNSALRKGERIVAALRLKAREPRLFAALDTAEEGLIRLVEPSGDILQHLGMYFF
ncbi:MAG: hypothetical protein K0Q59_6135, partial [Paenibacillus sp.]|nr:hypothetical protein [Paenibacillus sp.]